MADTDKLVDGCIPPNAVCPWWERCGWRQVTCPNPLGQRPRPFSCAAARAFEIVDRTGNTVLARLVTKQ